MLFITFVTVFTTALMLVITPLCRVLVVVDLEVVFAVEDRVEGALAIWSAATCAVASPSCWRREGCFRRCPQKVPGCACPLEAASATLRSLGTQRGRILMLQARLKAPTCWQTLSSAKSLHLPLARAKTND
jgi:hypothetical protein